MSGALWAFDEKVRGEGFALLCGVDEVGRGALAGPVVAAAVALGPDFDADGLDDSKKLTKAVRRELNERIVKGCASFGVGVVEADEIDSTDILRATLKAMRQAVEKLFPRPDFILVDGNARINGLEIPQKTVVKGDSRSASIAAASIVAKEYRDALMADLDLVHPGYGFAGHVGYGTAAHLAAIADKGPSPVHRASFKGVREHARRLPVNGMLF